MKFMQRREETLNVQKLEAERTATIAAAKWSAPAAPASVHGPTTPSANSSSNSTAAAAASSASSSSSSLDRMDMSSADSSMRTVDAATAEMAGEVSRLRLGRRSFGGFNNSLTKTMAELTETYVADHESGAVTAGEMARTLDAHRKTGKQNRDGIDEGVRGAQSHGHGHGYGHKGNNNKHGDGAHGHKGGQQKRFSSDAPQRGDDKRARHQHQ